MISRWWLVPLDLILGGRLGPIFAARDGFFAVRESQQRREQQRRFDIARDHMRDALQDRRSLEDELLRTHGGR